MILTKNLSLKTKHYQTAVLESQGMHALLKSLQPAKFRRIETSLNRRERYFGAVFGELYASRSHAYNTFD